MNAWEAFSKCIAVTKCFCNLYVLCATTFPLLAEEVDFKNSLR